MDSDGTEVDEEDYFGFVAADSVFLLLEDGDSWSRSSGMWRLFGVLLRALCHLFQNIVFNYR